MIALVALAFATGACRLPMVSPDATPVIPPAVFLEKAYFSPLTPEGKGLLFEGQPSVHYFIYNGLADGTWQKKGGWRFAVPVSALFIVRMKDTTSEPVLTPSYRIRPVYGQAFHLWRASSYDRRYSLLGLGGGVTHYSNGQRGCFYSGFVRDSLGACVPSTSAPTGERKVNTEDGDFSTTYLSASANFRRAYMMDPFGPLTCQWSTGIEYQEHPLGFKPGGINRTQAREWGRRQFSWVVEGERRMGGRRLRGVGRLAGDVLWRFGGGVRDALSAGSVEASYAFDRFEHIGVFARQHWGFDYYNIRFRERRPFFSIGLVWDLGRLDKLESGFSDETVSVPPKKGCRF